MDAEHRHELKQNDFIVYAKKTPDYIKKHWWESICVVVIIVALIFHFSGRTSPRRPNLERQAQVTSIFEDLADAKGKAIMDEAGIEGIEEHIQKLLTQAQRLKGPQKSFALIKAAEAVRARLLYSDAEPSQQDIEAHAQEAISLYERALDEAQGNVIVEAMANYGIALAKEDMGKFDEAANIYGQIIANSKYDKTAFVAMAKNKLDLLPMSRQSFVFVEPDPETLVEEEDEQPEGMPGLDFQEGALPMQPLVD